MPTSRLSLRVIFCLVVVALVVAGRDAAARSVAPTLRVSNGETVSQPPRSDRLNRYQQRAISDYFAGTARAPIDSLRILAIRVNFADSTITAGRDSVFFANELKHLAQYFDGASLGRTNVVWRLASQVYDLPEPLGYYGVDALEDDRVVELMQSVIELADGDEDFSTWDTFMVIHAGPGQETDILANSLDQLFSTFLDRDDIDAAFPDSSVAGLATGDSLGGEPFFVDNFMVVPERSSQDGQTISTLGIWAFLTGSRIGLIPLFDSTPAAFPDSRGIGDFDLMSNGLFNVNGFIPGFPCALNRLIAGWIDPLVVEEAGTYRLRDINTPAAGDTTCLKIPITETEYFLVANRVHDTNFDSLFTFSDFDTNLIPDNSDSLGGAEFDFWLTDLTNPFIVKFDPNTGFTRRFIVTGSGLYIWHVDESVIRQNIASGFLPNDFVSRKGVDLEEADGVPDLDNAFSGFSFGSHFDSFRAGHNDRFGPGTNPPSAANSGARTGVEILDISAPAPFMTLRVAFSRPYEEQRTRWSDRGRFQPPTVVDLDGAAGQEILVLADSGRVYAFDATGNEFVDGDNNPETIAPYIEAPGAMWRGAPAIADIDGGSDVEIVAFSTDGTVYAWRTNGTEVTDGDGIPGTVGILYEGLPLAAPPMLVDFEGDGTHVIATTWQDGDSLELGFVDGAGAVLSALPTSFPPRRRIQAQFAAPLALGLSRVTVDLPGVVVVWADTLRNAYGVTLFGFSVGVEELVFPAMKPLEAMFPPASGAAVGDFDGDGRNDEVAVTLPDGRLVIHSLSPAFHTQPLVAGTGGGARTEPAIPKRTEVVDLRSSRPSAPALGDVDGDGGVEIALWDNEFFYVYELNGRLATNWPVPLRASGLGDFPPLEFGARLNAPVVADIDGDGASDVAFATTEGTIWAFRADGRTVPGFPRPGPAASGATPTVADVDGDGDMELVTLGSVPRIGEFESVSDTIVTAEEMVLSLQSLPGSDVTAGAFWTTYRHDLARTGRLSDVAPGAGTAQTVVPNSFIVYPNPVRGDRVHARIQLNRPATVAVQVYNLEGEKALSQGFVANRSGVLGVPFDEVIDVSRLDSGVYVMRLVVDSEAFVKTFAILR